MIKKMINYKHKMDRIYKLKSPDNVDFKYDINDCIKQLKKIKLTYGRHYVGIVQHSGNVVVSKRIRWRSECILGYEHTTLFENEFMFVIDKNEEISSCDKPYCVPFNSDTSILISQRVLDSSFLENFIRHQQNIRENTYQVSFKRRQRRLKKHNHRRR